MESVIVKRLLDDDEDGDEGEADMTLKRVTK